MSRLYLAHLWRLRRLRLRHLRRLRYCGIRRVANLQEKKQKSNVLICIYSEYPSFRVPEPTGLCEWHPQLDFLRSFGRNFLSSKFSRGEIRYPLHTSLDLKSQKWFIRTSSTTSNWTKTIKLGPRTCSGKVG
jgi:hypothetical protein